MLSVDANHLLFAYQCLTSRNKPKDCSSITAVYAPEASLWLNFRDFGNIRGSSGCGSFFPFVFEFCAGPRNSFCATHLPVLGSTTASNRQFQSAVPPVGAHRRLAVAPKPIEKVAARQRHGEQRKG